MVARGVILGVYGYIIMSMGTDIISVYIFIQFMENIPDSLDESAIIDGASYFQIYWKIILPLLQPYLQRILLSQPVLTEQGYPYHSNVPVYIYRTSRKPLQHDLRGRYHFPASGIDHIYRVPETDLQWYYRGSCQRLR